MATNALGKTIRFIGSNANGHRDRRYRARFVVCRALEWANTRRLPYSVAEHSLLVLRIFEGMRPKANIHERMFALLHDAPEYVIGDMISPVKHAVGSGYEELDSLQRDSHSVWVACQNSRELKKQIKQADKYSARLEASEIAGFSENEANKLLVS